MSIVVGPWAIANGLDNNGRNGLYILSFICCFGL